MPTMPYTSLGAEDLEEWAGATIFKRGKSYRRRVHDLAVTEEGHLVADVVGSENYVTRVWMTDGEPGHECSCPYDGPCKHAVAVILTYLDCIAAGTPVPRIDGDELSDRLSTYGLPEGFGTEEAFDPDEARAALDALTKAQLVEWAMDRFAFDPSLFDTLPLAGPLTDEARDWAVARLRRQIRKTASERGWQDYWRHEGHTPDYSPIREQLKKLLNDGHHEAVLKLGEELLKLGTTQVEESGDEGETAGEIRDCLAVVLAAMGKTKRPAAERMIWYWDKLLNDSYCLLDGLTPPVNEVQMKPADWREVAEVFGSRLAASPKPAGRAGWSSERFRREQLLKYTRRALGEAGEEHRAIELMIAELPYCDNYADLVDALSASKDDDQAVHWIYQGFRQTSEHSPGIAWKLVEQLLDIARRRQDWSLAAALRVEEFLERSTVDNYRLVEQAARKKDCWPQVRSGLLCYLETGAAPSSSAGWSLPDTGLPFPARRFRRDTPDHDSLITIALHEKRTEDALRWFREAPYKDQHADRIAEAVAKTHPDVSIDLWQGKAESLIARVKPSAYREAMPYLSKMERLMQRLGRSDDYPRYIAALRARHKAKRRLMAELDGLEKRKKKA